MDGSESAPVSAPVAVATGVCGLTWAEGGGRMLPRESTCSVSRKGRAWCRADLVLPLRELPVLWEADRDRKRAPTKRQNGVSALL